MEDKFLTENFVKISEYREQVKEKRGEEPVVRSISTYVPNKEFVDNLFRAIGK